MSQLPTTELRNPASAAIDGLTALQIVELMNAEDATVSAAVATQATAIARAIDVIAESLRNGGRLIYLGAGTSGRLGVLDASECPPTFSTRPEMIVGLIAGGFAALTQAIEGAEDNPSAAVNDLRAVSLSSADVVTGIASSGSTPYVVGGLQFARQIGAFTIGLVCTPDSGLARESELVIAPVVGPEIITGSTRLKAGTATKMVLNMLTTGAMIRLGKTYGNLMVDLKAANEKLRRRTCRIVGELTGLAPNQAQAALEQCGGELKTAVVSIIREVPPNRARELLQRADGHLRRALDAAEAEP